MIRFELPSLGADMDEGTLLEWKVAPGERVARGQVVAVVDTSKAAVDVEIWRDGIVAELLVNPGEKIPVGTVLATLREPGEVEAEDDGSAGPPQASVTPPGGGTGEARPRGHPESSAGPPQASVTPPGGGTGEARPRGHPESSAGFSPMAPLSARDLAEAVRHRVSPAARKRARELGIDPDLISDGTGPQGAVTIADVERAAARPPQPVANPPAVPSQPTMSRDLAVSRQREMRRAIAAAMSRSKHEIPHYYLSETIPMARALAWLQEANAARPITERLLPAVLQLKAVALALARVPELNGFHRDGEFMASEAVHVGVAISLRGGGLVAPALHDVRIKPLEQLMRELTDLVRRARAGSLRSSEMSDPTITVTNLGDQGSEAVFPIIYPPQVAIVGFGRIVERPWAQDGWIRAVPTVTATLAADHRVSDGHRGALFLTALADWLQRPADVASSG
jgi:pyruvate dehydrogenase E2 component (dihydrolipoamide acetyltransferase)